jgi:hypothetical protein
MHWRIREIGIVAVEGAGEAEWSLFVIVLLSLRLLKVISCSRFLLWMWSLGGDRALGLGEQGAQNPRGRPGRGTFKNNKCGGRQFNCISCSTWYLFSLAQFTKHHLLSYLNENVR